MYSLRSRIMLHAYGLPGFRLYTATFSFWIYIIILVNVKLNCEIMLALLTLMVSFGNTILILPTKFRVLNCHDCGLDLPVRLQQIAITVFSLKIVSELDQEIPLSQSADNPVAPRRRAAQPSRDTRKTN